MNNLRAALRDRQWAPADGEITADSTVAVVGQLWLRELDESDRAIRTKVTYRDVWSRHVQPAVGALRVRDMRVSRVDRVVRELRQRSGEGTAKHAKVILSGLLGLAVRHDALDSNPVRELASARGKRREKRPGLTEASWAGLRKFLRDSPDAKKYDLVDLVEVLSGLGCRIGELLALDWPRVDDVAGTIAIEGTVVRVPGEGLVVQLHTKSKAGMRTITPPPWVIALLRSRHADSHGPWVFPSTRSTLRDPDNTRKQLREVVAGSEWEGLNPHAFRHLVATRLDAAGLSAREIADYLGHERISMTQDVYMSRKATGANAAAALDLFGPQSAG
jgi:integrase